MCGCMCGLCNVCVCVCVWVFWQYVYLYLLCFVLFVLCFLYCFLLVHLFFFVLSVLRQVCTMASLYYGKSVLRQALLPPSANSIAVNNNNNNNNNAWVEAAEFKFRRSASGKCTVLPPLVHQVPIGCYHH
jgi:cellulose synthase/poly-beta-1,6-N-acetylglucosamine synthase-like glycosyltransferase